MKETFDVVTGGAGFIGSHLCEALLAGGRKVRVIDDFSTGTEKNLESLQKRWPDRIQVFEIDVRKGRDLAPIFKGVETVYHEAAVTSVEMSVRDPIQVNSVNVGGTLSVLKAARDAGAGKLVFASSTAVYGNTPEQPKREDGPIMPQSPYAVTKLCGEHYCKVFAEVYHLASLCLRYFNVYGPRQDLNSPYAAVIPRFVDRILGGLPPVIYGDGEQTRDFVYVEDVVAANLLAAQSPSSGLVLNVASGKSVNLKQLAARLNEIEGTSHRPVHEAPRLGEARHSSASIDLARISIGFRPKVDLEEGLKRTAAWFREQGS